MRPRALKSLSKERQGMLSRSVVTTTNEMASQKESRRAKPGPMGSSEKALRAIEVFLNMTGDIVPSCFQPLSRELLSEFEQLPCGLARLRAGLEGPQLGDGLFPDRNLDRRAGVPAHLPDESGKSLSHLADGEFHEVKCTRVGETRQ